jgi:hypothetical protein
MAFRRIDVEIQSLVRAILEPGLLDMQQELCELTSVITILVKESDLNGASGESRTHDRRFTKPLLYH